jgi:hypothetical protein
MKVDGQLSMFLAQTPPPPPPSIDLRLCSVAELVAELSIKVPLVVADPPWHYSQAPGHSANPDNHYSSMSDADVVRDLDAAAGLVDAGRLAVWCTWPKLGQFMDAIAKAERWRWKYVTGGSWTKTGGRPGTGYHWLGQSELVLLFRRGTNLCAKWGALTNAHVSSRQLHSEKPADWMAGWIERWTEEGDTVVDLYAGLAPVARACLQTRRHYVGAELSPERHAAALTKLRQL